MGEFVKKEDFKEIRQNIRECGKKVVLCHGVFDLVHVGHVEHFEKAKSYGDVLVVSITAAQYVRKGPGRPYFDNMQRIKFLESLKVIDYVLLSESYTVDDIVPIVQPDIYVKGEEYKDETNDLTGMINSEVALVKKYGGEVRYTGGEVFSSTKLINNVMPVFSDEMKNFLIKFSRQHGRNEMLEYIEKFRDKKILIVGDVIIDDYIFCKLQGLMSKNIGYSARFVSNEKYLGGSVAIAREVAEFSDNVTLLSIMGNEPEIHKIMEDKCEFNLDIISTDKYQTIIKTRYVEADEKRKLLDKIFAINNLSDSMAIDKEEKRKFIQELVNIIDDYDAVFLCDFGHGLIDKEVKSTVELRAKKIVLNCQTNSSNYGLNLITKYDKADFFTLDEKELHLAYSDYSQNQEESLKKLSNRLHGSGCLTRGSRGCLYIENNIIKECPAFVLEVSDTIGAGDAFYSLFGMMCIVEAPIDVAAFMGNIGGALASNITGNKEPVKKEDILKYMCTLLNI